MTTTISTSIMSPFVVKSLVHGNIRQLTCNQDFNLPGKWDVTRSAQASFYTLALCRALPFSAHDTDVLQFHPGISANPI